MKNHSKSLCSSFVLLLLFTACQPAAPDYEAQYSPLLDKFVEVFNTGNLDLVEEIYAPNGTRRGSDETVTGHEEIKKAIQGTRDYWPGVNIDFVRAVYSADQAVLQWRGTGTERNTGKEIEVDGVSIFTIAGGKITDDWSQGDFLSGYQRLGYTLAPPQTAAEER